MAQQQTWTVGRVLGGAALATWFGAAAVAAPNARPNDARADAARAAPGGAPVAAIAAHDTFYVWAGAAFDDLNRLEAAVAPRGPGALVIYACGSGANWALMAAAHRFGERYLVRPEQPADGFKSSRAAVAAMTPC